MNKEEQNKSKEAPDDNEPADEIDSGSETGGEVNKVIEQQANDAAAVCRTHREEGNVCNQLNQIDGRA
ncbi:MAG: hypothetical protein JO080_13855 [Mucilaginibacter sp.]|nr:hypothetical protein [Mucilaginibacter sp.]